MVCAKIVSTPICIVKEFSCIACGVPRGIQGERRPSIVREAGLVGSHLVTAYSQGRDTRTGLLYGFSIFEVNHG